MRTANIEIHRTVYQNYEARNVVVPDDVDPDDQDQVNEWALEEAIFDDMWDEDTANIDIYARVNDPDE